MTKIEEIARFFNENADFRGMVKQNEPMKAHTTMNVGGEARLFLEPSDAESLVLVTRILIEEKIAFFVLGGGSNVVISDSGLDAVISTRKMNGIKLDADDTNRAKKNVTTDYTDVHRLRISCGASWGSVISFCKKNNLGGFEAFSGLSGTVGGALFMNATCFGLSVCDNLVSVEYFDLCDGELHTYEKHDSDWGYKKSPFQVLNSSQSKRVHGEYFPDSSLCSPKLCEEFYKIIISAIFRVHEGFDSQKAEFCLASRKEKGHFRSPSAGSAFKNDAAHGIIAGKVIDECGLKGFSVGGAQIAPWHGNFIINPERTATARDVKNLSDEVKRIVREKTGVELESEILFVGF